MSSDSDETMRSPGASVHSDPHDLEDIIAQRETAQRVYDDTRAAFYAWAEEHARTTIARLARPRHRPPPPLPEVDPEQKWPRQALFLPDSDSSSEDNAHTVYFDVDEFNPFTGTQHTRVRTTSPVIRAKPFSPYPRYTMCTPASRSVPMRLGTTEPITSDAPLRAAYAPFADDASFDVREYLTKFDDFAWQKDIRDPDLEIIQYDTARRLHFQHHLSLDAIDALEVFDTPVRSIIRTVCHRDYLRWPGSQLDTLPMFTLADAAPPRDSLSTLYDDLTAFLPSFCANLNCLMPFCKLHGRSPAFVPPTPHLTGAMMQEIEGEACGEECYKNASEEDVDFMDNFHWTEADHDTFNSVIKLTPDTAPCDLAVICRKPCIEMYIARLRAIADTDVEPAPDPKAKPMATTIKFVEHEFAIKDKAVKTPHPVGPCAHEGPCGRHAVDCVCAMSAQHCMRTCRCASNCALRFRGCRCRTKSKHIDDAHGGRSKGKGRARADDDADWGGDAVGGDGAGRGDEDADPCADDDCPCRAHGRECDPELCVGCGARPIFNLKFKIGTHGKCHNRSLQQGETHPIHVKASKYGLGAFAVSAIRKGACVGEYVGEIAEGDVPHLPRLQDHVGLNYVFELSQSFDAHGHPLMGTERIIDSWNFGNPTRFLNHPEPETTANCTARTFLVNGVHRIGIFTDFDIKAGQELTLNYGENYWGVVPPESNHYAEDDYDPANIVWPGWYNA